MHPFWTASLASLIALGALAPSAHAYVWYKTDTDAPMRWFRPEVTMRVSTVAPEEVDWDEMDALVKTSMAAWDIPGCKIPQVDIVGTTDAETITTPEHLDDEPDNIVVFIKSRARWSQLPGATGTQLALTFIANNPDTGEIIDADVAINDAGFAFFTDENATTGVDLQATLTHEFGHFFGMGHSLQNDATMYASYGTEGAKRTAARTLEKDDEDGICDLYEDVPAWNPPSTGGGGGGDCAAGGGDMPAPIALAFAVLLIGGLRRRRALS